MGTYDTVHDGDRYEQVKLWGKGLRYLHVGDRVGLPRGGLGTTGTYSVAMVSGGFVQVVDGVITGWHEAPGAGPQLTTSGGTFDPADWPGGPFGPWYRDADAPPDRRIFADLVPDCPRHGTPPLRVIRADDPDVRRDVALAVARVEVAARLAAGLDEKGRIAAAREYLADRTGYRQVMCEAASTLLGMDDDPVRGGERLVRLLSSAGAEAPEWSNAAALAAERAADLPAHAVTECLRLLAAALPPDVRPRGDFQADPVSDGEQTDEHPAIRRRRRSVSRDGDDPFEWLRRYADRDFQAAAEAAVARHGAAVLPPIPLTFWTRDIAAYELMVPLLTAVLGRAFTSEELWVLDAALHGLPGTLDSLDAGRLTAALDRALDR